MIKIKKAFSLIEVIFVLVILGIVASLSSQIIVQVYENYITQKALYTTSSKTEMAINQIVNRLTFSIEGTTITKNPLSPIAYNKGSEGNNWIRLKNIDVNLTNARRYTTIEWIGYDNDGFSATDVPHWSGIADYDDNITATIGGFETPGSRLDLAHNIISNLSNNKVDLNGGNLPAILFSDVNYLDGDIINGINKIEHDPACMGLIDETNTTCISRVQMNGNSNFTFPDNKQKKITERYKLAWSAYALVPEDLDGDGLFDLFLYSNYQPWNNEAYSDNGVTKNLLINNVSVFKFTENGGVIQIKLCASADIGQRDTANDPVYISSCKEKAIIK